MQAVTIDDARGDARQKYREYVKQVRHGRKDRYAAEDAMLLATYRQLARGKTLIDVAETIKRAGVDELCRPRLAFARADSTYCYFRHWHNSLEFSGEETSSGPRNERKNRRLQLPLNLFGGPLAMKRFVRAIAPMIPPALRPAGKLDRYHILWEADWEAVPVDPMLLQHVVGHMYVVLASWGLTPLERSVLAHAHAANGR